MMRRVKNLGASAAAGFVVTAAFLRSIGRSDLCLRALAIVFPFLDSPSTVLHGIAASVRQRSEGRIVIAAHPAIRPGTVTAAALRLPWRAGELEWQAVSIVADRLPKELRARSGDHVTNPPPHLVPLPRHSAVREDDGRFRSRTDRRLRLRGASAGSVTAR